MRRASMDLFAVPVHESLAERCARLAAEVAVWEADITARVAVLPVSDLRQALEEAAQAQVGVDFVAWKAQVAADDAREGK